MKSEIYIQGVVRRLSPTARSIVAVELGRPETREAAIQALWSPNPELALAQIVAHRIAIRMQADAGLGIETMNYGQFKKTLKAESADELAALKAAKKTKNKAAIAEAKQAYKVARNQFEKVKTTKDERKAIVLEIGKAGAGHHWIYKRDTKTGELVAVRVENKESGNFFSKIGRAVKPFVPIIIGVVGAVLAPFTGGASLAAAAVLSAAYSINQKRIATNKAKREGKTVAKQMQAQVDAESKSLNKQLDDLFHQNQEVFTAAGITSAQWAGMSVDQKLAVVERINSGKMPSTAENVAAVANAQGTAPPASLPPDQPIASTISESPFMTPEGSVDSKPAASGGGGGMLLLAGGAALVGATMLSGQHGHR
jgi:hypothetical protein